MKIIDVHTHGIGGFDTRTASDQHILKIAQIQGSLGVSEIVPTVYPSSIETMRENMHAIKEAMVQQACRDEPAPDLSNQKHEAKITGIHLEGPFLNPSKCGALDPCSFIDPTDHNFKKLIEGFEAAIKIITIAPELAGAVSIIGNISRRGIIASMGHSDATYAEAEAGFRAGARGITHIFNAMRGIHHREPGLAGFGLINKDIYIEVIADPFHLDRKIIDLIFSVKNPERIIIISDSVKGVNMVHSSRGMRSEDGSLLGGAVTLNEAAEQLIQSGLESTLVSKAMSDNPREYLRPGHV